MYEQEHVRASQFPYGEVIRQVLPQTKVFVDDDDVRKVFRLGLRISGIELSPEGQSVLLGRTSTKVERKNFAHADVRGHDKPARVATMAIGADAPARRASLIFFHFR